MNEESHPMETDEFETPEGHRSGFVAVVGRPNVGKSTLMNALLGEKIAIVSPKPQTTRIRQLGILTREDTQIIFVDTPGIHHARTALGEFMVSVAIQALRDADVVIFVTDVSEPPNKADENVADIIKTADVKVVRVLNKVDITKKDVDRYREIVDQHLALVPYIEWTTTVATENEGTDKLLSILFPLLPQGPRFYPSDQVSDLWQRDIVAELIRESILLHTEQEIPHSVAVEIDEFKQRSNGMTYVAATLFVERDSQKAILIGKQGKMVKRISTHARSEIEKFINSRVYLELRVKVLKNWRTDENALRRFGYRLEK